MSTEPIPLRDVKAQFQSLATKGDEIGFRDGGKDMFPQLRFKASPFNLFGSDNHFQGLVRKGSGFYISGGFPKKNAQGADVCKMEFGSVNADLGPLGSNMDERKPPSEDRVVLRDQLDTTYWHPGGLGLSGSVLAVPLEGNKHSIIRFYDVDQVHDNKFKKLDDEIKRPLFKAGAAALTRLPNGFFLLAVWSDSDKLTDVKKLHLDFYIYKGDSIKEIDRTGPISYFPDPGSQMHHKFQSMSFVWQGKNKLERLFLMTFENTTDKAPIYRGANVGRLFEIEVPNAWLSDPKEADVPQINFVNSKTFDYHRKWCNMDAGSSAYVDEQRQLCVYSCYHFRKRGTVRCVEFKSSVADNPSNVPIV